MKKEKKLTISFDPQKATMFLLLVSLVLFGFLLGKNQDLLTGAASTTLLSFSRGETLSPSQLKALLKVKNPASPAGGFTLINVHTPYEGEIEKTDAFISYDQIPSNTASLPKDKNAPIILYCKTGRMSGIALQTLKKMGYTNVRHLAGGMDAWEKSKGTVMDLSTLENDVVPEAGITLPVSWGTIGPKLIELGVIDEAKFRDVVRMTPEQEEILTKGSDNKIKIDRTNGQFIVDMLWAIGLGQKSIVYEQGPMGKEYKKDAGNFASTGGWSLARGDAMEHLNRYDLIPLTDQQQKLVGDIAQNVYRPCCGNSTWFPDCNHGMAALAAIELMVTAGVPEKDIYRSVLALNSYWFADTYLTTATYFARQGTPWTQVDAKAVLGIQYSSGKGAAETAKKVGPLPYRPEEGGGGCGA